MAVGYWCCIVGGWAGCAVVGYLDELVGVDFYVVHVCYLLSVQGDGYERVRGVCWFVVDSVEVDWVSVSLGCGVVYSVYSEGY